nr:MAG TPA: hypothetical protein [Caudoviricetes sp.]
MYDCTDFNTMEDTGWARHATERIALVHTYTGREWVCIDFSTCGCIVDWRWEMA